MSVGNTVFVCVVTNAFIIFCIKFKLFSYLSNSNMSGCKNNLTYYITE